MGIETILFAAFTGLQVSQTMSAGKREAREIVRQGELRGKEKAKETRYRVARQTASFLDAGLTLKGTPETVIGETFQTGKEDIAEIAGGANIRAKGAIKSARGKAIGQITGAFTGAQLGSMFATAVPKAASFLPESSLFAASEAGFGSTAFEALEFRDLRG